jgi:hypothetical protein
MPPSMEICCPTYRTVRYRTGTRMPLARITRLVRLASGGVPMPPGARTYVLVQEQVAILAFGPFSRLFLIYYLSLTTATDVFACTDS